MVVILKGRDEDVPEGSWRDKYLLKDPHWQRVSNIEFTSSTYDLIGASFLKRCMFFRRDFLYAKSLVYFLGVWKEQPSFFIPANYTPLPLPELPTNLGNRNQIANIIDDCWVKNAPPKKKSCSVLWGWRQAVERDIVEANPLKRREVSIWHEPFPRPTPRVK